MSLKSRIRVTMKDNTITYLEFSPTSCILTTTKPEPNWTLKRDVIGGKITNIRYLDQPVGVDYNKPTLIPGGGKELPDLMTRPGELNPGGVVIVSSVTGVGSVVYFAGRYNYRTQSNGVSLTPYRTSIPINPPAINALFTEGDLIVYDEAARNPEEIVFDSVIEERGDSMYDFNTGVYIGKIPESGGNQPSQPGIPSQPETPSQPTPVQPSSYSFLWVGLVIIIIIIFVVIFLVMSRKSKETVYDNAMLQYMLLRGL